jgi:hypothetical protein
MHLVNFFDEQKKGMLDFRGSTFFTAGQQVGMESFGLFLNEGARGRSPSFSILPFLLYFHQSAFLVFVSNRCYSFTAGSVPDDVVRRWKKENEDVTEEGSYSDDDEGDYCENCGGVHD